MTLPPIVRIFFAIDLPLVTKEKLSKYISSLKKRAKSNHIRWVKVENLHITLQFLAEVQAEHVDKLVNNVRKEIEKTLVTSPLTMGALQLFPNPYRPRVIVLNIMPQDELALLAAKVGRGIQSSQYEIEQRPFKAHLTIGRIKYAQSANLSFLSEFAAPDIEPIAVEEIVLFRSEPLPEGSVYTVLERIRLQEKTGAGTHSGTGT